MAASVILFHKQSTSARTRFLRFADDTVCGFAALPADAVLVDPAADTIAQHPAAAIADAARTLGLAAVDIEAEGGFVAEVEADGTRVAVFLGRFTAIDPPFELAATLGARFVDLTQARDLPAVELALLRRAYETVLGG